MKSSRESTADEELMNGYLRHIIADSLSDQAQLYSKILGGWMTDEQQIVAELRDPATGLFR